MALPDLVTNAGQKIQELIHPPPTPVSYDSPLPQPQIIPQFNPADELPQTEVTLSNNVLNTESDLLNNKITFSTIYLSLRKTCVEREIDLMEFTHYLTEQYLRVYGYDIGKTSMKCVYLYDYANGNYESQLTAGKDFLLFASNALEARQYIGEKYYPDASHTEPVPFSGFATSSVVLITAYQSDKTAWLLSHELAHWVLINKGDPDHLEGVHNYQAIWNNCYHDPDQCSNVWFTIEYPFKPYAQRYYMMDVRSLL